MEARESENGLMCSLIVEIIQLNSEEDISGQQTVGRSCVVNTGATVGTLCLIALWALELT